MNTADSSSNLFSIMHSLTHSATLSFQAALDELQLTQPRTTLTVAHRLLTVKDCDTIAFLGDGGVLEMGTHSELLELKGKESFFHLSIPLAKH